MNGRKLALEAGAVDRRRVIRDIVAGRPIGSQAELAEVLVERGYAVTQATISRDIAELGLVKVTRGDRHAYVSTDDLGPPGGGRHPAAGRAERPGPAPDRHAGHRRHDRPGDRRVDPDRTGGDARGRQYAPR